MLKRQYKNGKKSKTSTQRVFDSLGRGEWSPDAFIQVPPLPIPGVRFRGNGGIPGRRTLNKKQSRH